LKANNVGDPPLTLGKDTAKTTTVEPPQVMANDIKTNDVVKPLGFRFDNAPAKTTPEGTIAPNPVQQASPTPETVTPTNGHQDVAPHSEQPATPPQKTALPQTAEQPQTAQPSPTPRATQEQTPSSTATSSPGSTPGSSSGNTPLTTPESTAGHTPLSS